MAYQVVGTTVDYGIGAGQVIGRGVDSGKAPYEVVDSGVDYAPVSYPDLSEPSDKLLESADLRSDKPTGSTDVLASAPPLSPGHPAHNPSTEEPLLANGDVKLTEADARPLLEQHVSHKMLWSMKPIEQASIIRVEDCSAYIASLESVFETRSIESKTFVHGFHPDGGDHVIQHAPSVGTGGKAPSAWDFDIGHLAPSPFEPKHATLILLYTKRDTRCTDCKGEGKSKCEAKGCEGIGRPKVCIPCRGGGLQLDDKNAPTSSHCEICRGTGKIPCAKCQSFGLIACERCEGTGQLTTIDVLHVEWCTKKVQKEVALHPTSTVRPLALLSQTEGHLMFREEAPDCRPVLFPDLDPAVARLSAQVIADRPRMDGRARRVFERHAISLVPGTCYFMEYKGREFQAYIYGVENKIFFEHYPACFAPLERKCVIL